MATSRAKRFQLALNISVPETGDIVPLGSGGGTTIITSDTAPENPSAGDLWFNSSDLRIYIYYDDGNSLQWVSANTYGPAGSGGESGGGATTYANYAEFPSSGNTTGDFAIALDTKALYMWDGTEWDRVYTGVNETPTWVTEPVTEYNLPRNGDPLTISMAATDPEGFPINYSYDTNPSNQSQATIVNNNDGSFTFTPSTSLSDQGSFVTRFNATDGLHVSSKYSTINLSFSAIVDYLIVAGGGGGGRRHGGGGGAAYTGGSTGTSQLGSGNGGSGVVIIRYPSNYLDATTTGTVEYTNANGYKTYKFTAGSASITW